MREAEEKVDLSAFCVSVVVAATGGRGEHIWKMSGVHDEGC